MREKRPAARNLPFHGMAKRGEIDLGEHEPGLSSKVLRCRPRDLIGRRKMDETIRQIDRRSSENADRLPRIPLLRRQDLESGGGMGARHTVLR